MIHVTTEVGRPGKKEREKRHFPDMHNQQGIILSPKVRGRRCVPHRTEGREEEWRPHNQYMNMKYTDSGLDWSSKLKYILAPDGLEYPAAEIWPDNWKALRPFPYTYRRSEKEWLLDPGQTKLGLKCLFDGVHKASAISDNEITHTMMYGHGRQEDIIDKRNSLTEVSPGDKSYRIPEYSPSFYNTSADDSMPRFRTGNSPYMAWPKKRADTFIPLVPLPRVKRETYRQKLEHRQKREEVDGVKKLEIWQPAKPISSTIPQLDPSELKKY